MVGRLPRTSHISAFMFYHLHWLPLIAFHLQLVLISYHPIFLRPYHFLKLVSFVGSNRTTSASVCLWLLRALYKYLNTIQYKIQYNGDLNRNYYKRQMSKGKRWGTMLFTSAARISGVV